MNRFYNVTLRTIVAIALGIMFSASLTFAQTYKVVKGDEGASPSFPSYYYAYQYNGNEQTQQQHYAYYMFYGAYYPYQVHEYIIYAKDLRAAGVCPGPISSLGLQFLKTNRSYQMPTALYMKNIPSTMWYLQYPNYNNPPVTGENYNYYFYTVSGFASTSTAGVHAAPGATLVFDDPNFTIPVVADTTWIDMNFNKAVFVWDGTSNIAVGWHRCPGTGGGTDPAGNLYMYTKNFDRALQNYYYAYQYNPYYYYYNYVSFPPSVEWLSYYYYGGDCAHGTSNYLAYSWSYYYDYYYNGNPYNYRYSYTYTRPLVRVQNAVGIMESFPDDVDPRRILRATDVYAGQDATHPKPSVTYYAQLGKTYYLTYKITGPNPSTSTIYEARSGGNTTIPILCTTNGPAVYTISDATGIYAGSTGTLDLTNAVGGSYVLQATMLTDCGTQTWNKQIIVAFPWDVAMAQIRSPQAIPKKNPLNVTMPLSCQLQNVGLNNIHDVDVHVSIKKYPSGVEVFYHDSKWTGNMATGDRATLDMSGKSFIPSEVGRYSAEYCATLNDNVDQQAANNCLPNSGTPYLFQVNYNEEAGAYSIAAPISSNSYFANRPLQPSGLISNNGILDLSDIPVKMEIFKLPSGTKVYSEQAIVQSVDANPPNNLGGVTFPLFTPDAGGQYQVCMTTMYPGDPDPSNDQICQTFTVEGNLSGTYTIGSLKATSSRNFPTIEAAANALYERGVSGAVTFELTDAAYVLNGTQATNNVALDLSGYVPGMSSTNTVTFKPSLDMSLSRGSITITLNSINGIGVLFGQQLTPSNPRSLAKEFPYIRSYSNSAGYYIFDGGLQKSIRVNLAATTPFRAAFYLGDGGQNITLKNLLVGNAPGTTASYASSLPRVYYTNGQFTYESDVRSINAVTFTYSGGIVARGKMPAGPSGNNAERLDTIIGKNNRYEGNEISGFGYGIVSLGIGTLLKGGANTFESYYNTGTVITKNLLTSVSRSGVYAGYEDGVQITNNRVHTVGQSVLTGTKDAAGIYLGGTNQYNVMDAVVTGNEISGVRADSAARGIAVEQVRNAYQSVTSSGGTYYAPNRAEKTLVASNTVWGLVRSAAAGSMAGIHVQTGRSASQTLVPVALDYFTRGDMVVNNTVFMTNDNVTGAGSVVGIAVQHGNGTQVINNAIALQGASNASTTAHAAIFTQGTLFANGKANDWYLPANAPAALISNKNAFWVPNAGIGHFVEISDKSDLVSVGTMTDLKTLSQWRTWTGQDISSVEGNFTTEHEYKGVAPNQQLRVKTNPQPIGSIINQRGDRLSGVTTDIDGQLRGAAGLGYDIGADEFDGKLYVSDLEVIDILKPSAYKSSTGATSDAEHIMTTSPVDALARIRNNGALPRTNADVRVRVYLETAASNNANQAVPAFTAAPVVDRTVKVSLVSGESKDVVMGIPTWIPQTYQQLFGYTVPTRLSAMSMNVTPRYRIEVTTTPDENNANNTQSKILRFFIKRAQTHIVVSARGASTVLGAGSTSNDIAGRLNADTIQKALRDLGFINSPGTGVFAYDVFDRGAWEDRAVDYTMYTTMFWSHDQTALTRTERDDIRNFIDAGVPGGKKNLAMSSQEPVRRHVGTTITADQAFVNKILRALYVAPGTPTVTPYTGKRIVGRALARNTEETITATGYALDAASQPALMLVYSDPTTSGIAQAAYSYKKGDRTTLDSIAGTATASLTANVVYLGIDWRHYARLGAFTGSERVLRGIIDFFETNGGTVVPVELVSFDAKPRGSNADVFWSTASERNADHFTVERSTTPDAIAGQVQSGTNTDWSAVSTIAAAGNSTERRDYTITDKDLVAGTYLYRLAMVDHDGAVERTGSVEVVIGGTTQLSVAGLMPQPATTAAELRLVMPQASAVRIDVVNSAGETVAVAFDGTLAAGTQGVAITTADLASGAYTLVVSSDVGRASVPMVVRK